MASADSLRYQTQVFKALGHPARLAMVQALAEGERCVCELTALVALDISTTSKHLALLTAAGVLVCERRANKVFYRLRTPCLIALFRCLEEAQAGSGAGCCR
jgi:DNA-binding transcriptional ArsR family regulator